MTTFLHIEKNSHSLLRKINLFVLCGFYVVAGINHFWHPVSYVSLVPPYLPYPRMIVAITGVLEIFAGILMLIPLRRKLAAWLIVGLLVAFIPAHIYMIQQKGCVSKELCVPEWVAWVRLFPLQFILIWWSWKTYRWVS